MSKKNDSYPISSKSRTKLNAFRWEDNIERSPGKSPTKSPFKSPSKPGHTNKENQTSWLNGVVEEERPQAGKGQSSDQTADPKPTKECPKTPGNRLPFADLISNAEDAFNLAPGQEFTPEDRVIWQHVPVSSNPDSTSQTSAARGKKRRRHSSSPSSSPLADNSKHGNQESFDLQSFQALLKTPQNDLVTDLLNNYVGKSTINGNEDLPPPRLSNLLSSSPQTPASAKINRDSSGLRRSISCNAEWPASKAKRRRIDGDSSRANHSIFSRSRSNVLDSGDAKTASLKSFVQKMESLHKAPTPADPPSSSPVPAANAQRNRSMSPIEEKAALRASEKATKGDQVNSVQPESRALRDTTPQGYSSEFEDDGLDLDLLEFADATLNSVTGPTHAYSNSECQKTESANGPSSEEHDHNDTENRHGFGTVIGDTDTGMRYKNTLNDFDEFDDDDEFPENINMLLTGCDNASVSTGPVNPSANKPATLKQVASHAAQANTLPPAKPEKPAEASSEDEFDDEDFDLEAIEQSLKQSGEETQNYVCHA